MIKELRVLRKTENNVATYIAILQKRGKLKTYVNENGYVCYDTEEYKAYKKSTKQGRPCNVSKSRAIAKEN